MIVYIHRQGKRKSQRTCSGMTLVEVLMSILILVTIMSGIFTGYIQANRMAEFSSMSLAAQSTASQGLEQALAARWDSQSVTDTNVGAGHADELGVVTNWVPQGTNTLDIPVSGTAISVTNYVTISWVSSTRPMLRQIRSDAVWTFPLTGTRYTNTVITLRAPDQ